MDTTRIASESTPKQRIPVAQILEDDHWRKHLNDKAFSPERKAYVARVHRHLTACRTGRLGSHLVRCTNCGRGLMDGSLR